MDTWLRTVDFSFAMLINFLVIFLLSAIPSFGIARDYVHIVGSTTLFPFVSVASEEFARTYRKRTPIVESIGTGAGFKLFCSGATDKPDLVAASRKISKSELDLCTHDGISNDDIVEIRLGNDGIVIANSVRSVLHNFSKSELFSALSFYVQSKHGNSLEKNWYENWDKISPLFNNSGQIEIYGPLKNTGTYESMINMIFSDICFSNKAFRRTYPNHDDLLKVCTMVRDDGKFVEVGTDENIIIQKMDKNPNAFGIFGYGFYIRNIDKVQANLINGIAPTYENIVDGSYALSRPLYLYFRKSQINAIPDLRDFLKEIVSENALGKYGYLTGIGLIVGTTDEVSSIRDSVSKL